MAALVEAISVKYVNIDELREWDGNPRVMGDDELAALKANIQRFGLVDPVIVNDDNLVIGGHQRIKAAKALGIKQVPVVRLNLSMDEVKVLSLALNRISGTWDTPKLASLLQELQNRPEVDLTGFTEAEINQFLATIPDFSNVDDRQDELPPLPTERMTGLGDMWELGVHHLLCADRPSVIHGTSC